MGVYLRDYAVLLLYFTYEKTAPGNKITLKPENVKMSKTNCWPQPDALARFSATTQDLLHCSPKCFRLTFCVLTLDAPSPLQLYSLSVHF